MRGFGSSRARVSNADTNPVPDFSSPMADNGTLNFFADTKGKDDAVPVNAKIYVGDYEARATQIADTDPATVAAGTDATGNLDNTAQFAPTAPGPDSLLPKGKARERWSTYNFVAVAPGYGFVRFSVKDLKPGQSRDITIHFATNYASAAQGATITGDALGTNTNLGNLIDDTEATNDGADRRRRSAGRWVVVALGDARSPSNIEQARRLGAARARQQPLHGAPLLRRCTPATAGKKATNPTCDGSIDAGWKKIITAHGRLVPVVNPRPVTHDETLRYFNAKGAPAATHVKFVVTATSAPGSRPTRATRTDPNNNADCRPASGAARCTRPSCRSSRRSRMWRDRTPRSASSTGTDVDTEGRATGPPAFPGRSNRRTGTTLA